MSRLQAIAERRGRLLARARHERAALGASLAPLAGAISVVDRGWALARWLRERPLLVAGTLAFVIAARPRRALGAVRTGLTAWQAWRWASRALGEPASGGHALRRR